ncbi:MAG: putative inorganic carbon transporter subunit DabA, partial [Chloroflexota bacterium]
SGAVSCFGFVGPIGLTYLRNLLVDSWAMGRPVEKPEQFGLSYTSSAQKGPQIVPAEIEGRLTGIHLEQRVELAAGLLKGMSLTSGFAPFVLLIGHGSSSVNNPYASGLDCGACGGHSGEVNARVAAAILNDYAVRQGLEAQGIEIPGDTRFVAGLHHTTTDNVTLFDTDHLSKQERANLALIQKDLAVAGELTRIERAPTLGLEPDAENVAEAIDVRRRDWSQVRPEWGLAGCASFVVAPRERTAGKDLEGRAFLHNYSWRQDDGFAVLETIMTAPMVVTSWINLQYYGSAVDNDAFGSGNKVLHNAVGSIGVLEGSGGDLRNGLPWQSVHDGERLVHEPLRLSVVIEAPAEAMTQVIANHPDLAELLDNNWLYLFAMNDKGDVSQQYTGQLTWRSLEETQAEPAVHQAI